MANNYGTNFSVEADNNDGTFKIRNAGSDRITLDEDGVILAPNTSISNINTGGDKSLVTKEYADANYSVGGSKPRAFWSRKEFHKLLRHVDDRRNHRRATLRA